MPKYGVKCVDSAWIGERFKDGRFLSFREGQERQARRLKPGDQLLLYESDSRKVVAAVQITGALREGRELPKRGRARYPLALKCETVVLLEISYGAELGPGARAPKAAQAWTKLPLETYVAVLAELCRQSRAELLAWKKAAEHMEKVLRDPTPTVRAIGLAPAPKRAEAG